MVFNKHYGNYEDLPFDLRHKGGAVVFDLQPDADRQRVEQEKKKLKDHFVRALRPFLEGRVGSAIGSTRAEPVLELDFADISTREKLGRNLKIESQSSEVPSPESIPLYGEPPQMLLGCRWIVSRT